MLLLPQSLTCHIIRDLEDLARWETHRLEGYQDPSGASAADCHRFPDESLLVGLRLRHAQPEQVGLLVTLVLALMRRQSICGWDGLSGVNTYGASTVTHEWSAFHVGDLRD